MLDGAMIASFAIANCGLTADAGEGGTGGACQPKMVAIWVGIGLLLTSTNFANTQAWPPPHGEGSITFIYQIIDNTGHRRTNGYLLPRGTSLDRSLYLEAEYAFTDRLSLTAGLPYVLAKYTDANPPAPPIPYLPVDQCHCWQSGWQDFGMAAVITRYAGLLP